MPGSVIPPPLVRGGQQMSSKLGPQASSQVVMPPLVRGAQVSRGAPLGQEYGQAAPSNGLPHINNRFQFSGWSCGAQPFPLPPSIVPHCLVPTPPHSKSTTSDNIPARGRLHSSWPPGRLCPMCKSRDRGSSSKALSVLPMSPTPVCSSISHR